MRRNGGFTLIEIAISVVILLVILAISIPSVRGVLADRRLRQSLDAMNEMVRQAQQHSVVDRQPYLIIWQKDRIILQPESPPKGSDQPPTSMLALDKGHAFLLRLPAALDKDIPAQWIFWPSGACEPANVRFKGPEGSLEANYSPLTARPELVNYAAR